MKVELRIEGARDQLENFRNDLEGDGIEKVIGEVREIPLDPLNPRALGMEPASYFVVVFTAHLAAGLAHDYLQQLRKKGTDRSLRIKESSKEA